MKTKKDKIELFIAVNTGYFLGVIITIIRSF